MGNLIVVLILVVVMTLIAGTLFWLMDSVNKFFNKF